MANFESYRTAEGATRHMAVIRLKGFKRTSKSFSSRKDAEEWAERTEREMKAARDRGGTSAEVGTITIRELIKRFMLDPTTRENSTSYLTELEQMLGEWTNEYGPARARSFGRLQVTAFRDKLLTSGRSPARANRYLSAMRRMWNWAIESGYVMPSSPWPTGVMLKEPDPKEVIATPEEVTAVFAACDAVDADLGMLVRFLVGTGPRITDTLSVTWRDVDEKRWDVAIRGTKTSRPQRVALLEPAREAIRLAKKVRKLGDDRVFWRYSHRLEPRWVWLKARKNFPAHLRDMRMHDCRHLCASLLAAAGATDVELAAQLGHSTLQMVKRYSHLRGGHRGTAHERLDKAFGE
jgi:integrase